MAALPPVRAVWVTRVAPAGRVPVVVPTPFLSRRVAASFAGRGVTSLDVAVTRTVAAAVAVGPPMQLFMRPV